MNLTSSKVWCVPVFHPHPGPLQNSLSPPSGSQSPSCAGREAGDVVPGAARLISETAQRVHSIGQRQRNDQHLQRIQALLSGRQAKGLTSGSLHTLLSPCPLTPTLSSNCSFWALLFLYCQHMHPISSASPSFCSRGSWSWSCPRITALPPPQVAGSCARAGCW